MSGKNKEESGEKEKGGKNKEFKKHSGDMERGMNKMEEKSKIKNARGKALEKDTLPGSKAPQEKLSYEQALAKLEELVEKIEEPGRNLSGIEKELKEAMELLKYCRGQLKGIETEFTQILREEDEL